MSGRMRRETVYNLVISGHVDEAVDKLEDLYAESLDYINCDFNVYKSLIHKAQDRGYNINANECIMKLKDEVDRLINKKIS